MENQLLPDGFACWNNKIVKLLTSDSTTGYSNVIYQNDRKRKKPYSAKYLPEGEKKQRAVPGSSSSMAWEAAAKLAYHLELMAEGKETLLPPALRAPRRSSEVRSPPESHLPASVLTHIRVRAQEVHLENFEKQAKREAKREAMRVARLEMARKELGLLAAPSPMTHEGLPLVMGQPLASPLPLLQVALTSPIAPLLVGPGQEQ